MYTLIIAEKPNAAEKIAYALAGGRPRKEGKVVPYYRLNRGGKEIVVVPAVGHLFVLDTENNGGWTYPVFNVEWTPTYTRKGSLWAKKYFKNIEDVAKNASEFISATDFDTEGSVIAFNVLKFICNASDGKRMKFSTLTTPDIIEAYENASPHLDFGQIEAGLARHHLDFYWGINLTRALTIALKNTGGFQIVSSGRVQSPTLKILKDREDEIGKFKPVPYWELILHGIVNGKLIEAIHSKEKFWQEVEAKSILDKCKGKDGFVASAEKARRNERPPFPFDLTTLQRESYRNFGYSPKQTLDIAQTLYEAALISYPRTSSQKLPAKIGYKEIIEGLSAQKEYSEFCSRLLKKTLRPNEGIKSDPAHPAIYPTGLRPSALNNYQKRLFDLIVKRFLATFAEPAVRETNTVKIDIEKEIFVARGIRTIEPGWIEFYAPYSKFKEVILPEINKGDRTRNEKIEMLSKETQPPERYSQATILREMEKLGLGTKATRAQILQTLYDRGYIKEKTISVTELGKSVTDALEKYCNDIVSVELTRKFEKEMEDIQNGKIKREDVVSEAIEALKKILAHFKENEKKIGETLIAGIRQAMKSDSTVGKCKCGGDLVVKYSRGGKRFIGCSSYPKCTETFSLPHTGSLTMLSRKCKCGLFVISVRGKGKRAWKLCVRCGFVK